MSNHPPAPSDHFESNTVVVDIVKKHAENADTLLSAGALIRNAREAAGLEITSLAGLLKVPALKLEALEQDRYDLLPDATFARALASSVCRCLKVDPIPVLEQLPPINAPKLKYHDPSINISFRSHNPGRGATLWANISWPVVMAIAVLLLGALIVIFLPVMKQAVDSTQSNLNKPISQTDSISATFSARTVSENRLLPSEQSNEPLMGNLVSGDFTRLSPGLIQTSVSTSATTPLSVSVPAATGSHLMSAKSAELPLSTDIINFRVNSQSSWVEVTDAKGLTVLSRTVTPGEVVNASGILPLTAVVGRANVTQVMVRGKAFEITALARDNVARFEVK